ncbi:MAG: hypothetical protein ACHQE5_08360, partial [Actinomycetes bacterium]
WLAWESTAGEPADPFSLGWRGLLVLVGGMALTGIVRKWQVLVLLAVLPALAAGAVRWTTGVDGVPAVVTDPAAWWMSAAAVAGGLFAAIVQPTLASWWRRGTGYWRAALAADVDRRNEARAARALARQQRRTRTTEVAAGDDTELDLTDEPGELAGATAGGADVSRRPGRAASARSAGRHRA